MNVLTLACSVPWAIRPEALKMILDIVSREHAPDFEAAAARLEARRREIDPQAVSTSRGTLLEGTRSVVMRGGTAVVPIEGPISRYANLFSDISGGTSIEMLAKDFQVALEDPSVSSILLHVDSPGGEVNGTGEAADMIYAARGQKPIVAYISHQGASAAYWLASAADSIVVAPSSLIGSIGVIATVPDPARKPGDDFQFVSSQSPRKRPDPHTKDGKSQIQTVIDDLADVFVDSVARNRGVSSQDVLEKYGAGDVMVGANAVQAGLADSIGSFEQVLADLNAPADEEAQPSTPAVIPSQPVRPARRTAMNTFERIQGYLAGLQASEGESPDSGAIDGTVIALPVATAQSVQRPSATDAQLAAERRERENLEQRLAASEAENRRIRAERIGELAAAFADREITAGRAMPSEQAQIVALYTMAATDDSNLGMIRQSDGTTSSRVSAVTAAYEARQSHNLTKEQLQVATAHQAYQVLANIEKTPGTGAEPPTPTEVDALLALSPTGRATLAARTNGHTGRN